MRTRIIQDQASRHDLLPPANGTGTSGHDHAPRPRPFGLDVVRRHPLVTFFVLSYVLAWGALPWDSFWAFSPLLSALIVVSIADGRTGLRRLGSRLIRWRVAWWWYAVAIAVPVGVQFAAIAANRAAGASAPSWDQFSSWYAVLTVFGMNMVFPLGGQLGEEPGWRGFALPRLQADHSPMRATVILAVLVTGWHAPLAFVPAFDLGPIDIVTTFAVTFWYAWLFNHTGGSVLLTLVAHSAEGTIHWADLWSGADVERFPWLYLVFWALVALAIVALDRAAWRSAPRSAIDRPADLGATGPR
jgi:membrane protease YdiL (CAAX protease family)